LERTRRYRNVSRKASTLIDERRLVTPPVRGRDSELKQIADAVAALARGRGGAGAY
jgi:hypothetical protein